MEPRSTALPAYLELTYDECLAWAKKYAGTPFNMLPLSVAAEGDAGPMVVMRSLFKVAAHQQNEISDLKRRLGYPEFAR